MEWSVVDMWESYLVVTMIPQHAKNVIPTFPNIIVKQQEENE